MAARKPSVLPSAAELIDRLSPETVQSFAQMEPEHAETCKRMLREAGLGALVGIIDILRPEALA